jgi:hypothetical protein
MAERKRAALVGLAAIDRSIRTISGIVDNLFGRIQETAVAIVVHAAGPGNGDMSRALTLCQAVNKHRSMNVNYLVGWFAAFAGTNVNLREATVKLFAKDNKKQRGFRVDEAKANNWFEAVDANGDKAKWYAGPVPDTYEPDGIGDIAQRMQNFVKNTAKRLDDTKTVNGKEVPVVRLTAEDRQQVESALAFIDRIAATIARHESVQKLEEQLKKATDEAGQDKDVLAVLEPKEEAVA